MTSSASDDRARWLTMGLGLGFTLGLVWLHVAYLGNAGALWRDEVNSVNVASMPSWGAVFAHGHLDSFPLAWVTVLHAWIAAGLGETDADFRRLGFIIGLGTLGTLWWTARRLGLAAPLVGLLLLGMSPSVVVYGDQVRGYGLGTLTIIWAVGAIWAFVQRPTGGTFLVAQLAAIGAVQSYYANAFLLLAVCAGAAAICIRRRTWPRLGAVGAIGAVAAASLAINWIGITYAARVSQIELENPGLGWRIEVFRHALAPDVPALSIAWGIAAILAIIGSGLAFLDREDTDERDGPLFALVMAAVGLAGFVWYLQFLARVPTQYWYYLSLMALIALACELGIEALVRQHRWGSGLRVLAIAAVAVVAAPGAARNVPLRMTNVDILADKVEELSQPRDLVVVLPWYCGITFARYYDGPAPWMTLPAFEDHRFHVHTEVKERMTRGDHGITTELGRIESTLRAGARVWIVGTPLASPPAGPIPLAPAPAGPEGWHVGPYLEGWAIQLGVLLDNHADKVGMLDMPVSGPMNRWERLELFGVEGWH